MVTTLGDNKARRSYLPDLNNYEKDVFASAADEEEEEEDDEDRGPEEEIPAWDVFKHFPPKLKTGSKSDTGFFDCALKVTKLLTYGVLFVLVLCAGIIAKLSILFAVSQIDDHGPVNYCDYNDVEERPGGRKLWASAPEESRITWYWCIFLGFAVPEVIGLLNASYYWLFKKRVWPEIPDFLFLLIVEGLHTIGLALLFLRVLPELNSVEAAVVASCTCVVPGLLCILSRNKAGWTCVGDVAAFAGQIFGVVVSALFLDGDASKTSTSKWLLPIALILTSCRWWGSYVSPHSSGLTRWLSRIKERLQASRGTTMAFTAIWRIVIFLASFIIIAHGKGLESSRLFDAAVFTGQRNITLLDLTIESSTNVEIGVSLNATIDDSRVGYRTVQTYYLPLIILVVHGVSAFVTYSSGKFACRTLMQGFGFAGPASLILPGSIATIVVFCALRHRDTCVFHGFLPDYIFFNAPKDIGSLPGFLGDWYLWIWLVSLLSQAWITRHIWSPHSERLAATERIFTVPTYDSLIVDQSTMLNRQRPDQDVSEDSPDAEVPITLRDKMTEDEASESNRVEKSDRVTRIIACATMWHETRDEMTEFVGSILRLDREQSSGRISQNYCNVELQDYYELETHVFFDDAFCCMHGCEGRCKHDENETRVNDYVMCLIETMKETVQRAGTRPTPPNKYPAPYGGRLEWTLPGKTSLVVHLKDKNKIRHRKRWSQVMYMYYLLGYRLMNRPISRERKATIAENTYLLTLDGDIDFRPSAVKVLVDLMKRDKDLGAACGRIHPIGTGPMVWFQKFEYAIGHWLQKSTEHTIGSVLCSPGCFSLFRARALMEHNVMRKYAIRATEPRHYVQYDQGEDRWLCTLILQVGYRVEYSAASDSYTHAPETFNEFYNQRRRWIPSTIANIFDLLSTADETRKVNDDISWLYIVYQWVLMGSTVLGPGTIFLMLVGAFVAAFRIDNWSSFGYNLIPIAIFVIVCVTCKANIQLMVAGIISTFYGLVMIVVLVGIMIQITEDGWLAPSTILFFVVASQLVIAGLAHPQEWSCLLCGLIYYVTVPSMYMLLIIFSLFNVNNVTWGTRDSKTTPVENEEAVPTRNEKSAAKGNTRSGGKTKERGSVEFSLAGLFKCMLCTQDTPTTEEDEKFKILSQSLDRIGSRLDVMERGANGNDASSNHRGERLAGKSNDFESVAAASTAVGTLSVAQTDSEDYLHDSEDETDDDDISSQTQSADTYGNGSTRESSNFLVSPYWLQDERLRKGGVEFLSREEESFWETLIEKYLFPLDEDKKQIAKTALELKNLRDEYLFKFFMLNALFVLIVFLMQLNKDVLHLEWPLGAKYNITFVPTNNMEVHLEKDYLKLEPIGCLFIVGFVLILGVQFVAMLFHRWDTFAHVLANTSIDWRCKCCRGKPAVEDDLKKHAEELAHGLQRLVEDNAVPIFARTATTVAPGKRNTVHELADSREEKRTKLPASIDTLFRRNLNNPRSEMSTLIPRRIMEAYERRHSTMVADQRRSQHQQYETDNIYHNPDNIPNRNHQRLSVPPENAFTYDNRAFLSNDSDDDLTANNLTIPHRPSQVKFGKEHNA